MYSPFLHAHVHASQRISRRPLPPSHPGPDECCRHHTRHIVYLTCALLCAPPDPSVRLTCVPCVRRPCARESGVLPRGVGGGVAARGFLVARPLSDAVLACVCAPAPASVSVSWPPSPHPYSVLPVSLPLLLPPPDPARPCSLSHVSLPLPLPPLTLTMTLPLSHCLCPCPSSMCAWALACLPACFVCTQVGSTCRRAARSRRPSPRRASR